MHFRQLHTFPYPPRLLHLPRFSLPASWLQSPSKTLSTSLNRNLIYVPTWTHICPLNTLNPLNWVAATAKNAILHTESGMPTTAPSLVHPFNFAYSPSRPTPWCYSKLPTTPRFEDPFEAYKAKRPCPRILQGLHHHSVPQDAWMTPFSTLVRFCSSLCVPVCTHTHYSCLHIS